MSDKPSYWQLRPLPVGEVLWTKSVNDHILVDMDANGVIYGVENLAGSVDMYVLLAVLRWLRTREEGTLYMRRRGEDGS